MQSCQPAQTYANPSPVGQHFRGGSFMVDHRPSGEWRYCSRLVSVVKRFVARRLTGWDFV